MFRAAAQNGKPDRPGAAAAPAGSPLSAKKHHIAALAAPTVRQRFRAGQLAFGSTFLLGSAGYGLLEVLWRGYTHWTMLLTGGVCLCGLRFLSRCAMPLLIQCALGSSFITSIEFLVGMLCNRALHWNVWDYSGQWGNVLGQVCPLYSLLWFLLCIPVLALLRAADRQGCPEPDARQSPARNLPR